MPITVIGSSSVPHPIRRPIAFPSGQARRANDSDTIATRSSAPLSRASKRRPATSGIESVSKKSRLMARYNKVAGIGKAAQATE